MLFFNFLGKTEFPASNGFLPVRVSDSIVNSEEDFPSCDVYFENGEVVVSEPDPSKESIFKCNDERALAVNNKIERNKEEDFLIMTDKLGFIENVKAYFRFIPFDRGILLCLYGGAIKINDGTDWMVLSRNGKGTKEGIPIYQVEFEKLVDSVAPTDEKTGYNMIKDGVTSCEMSYTNNKNGVTMTSRSFRDEFTLLNEEKLKKETEKWEKKEEELARINKQKAEARKRNREREAEWKRKEAEKEREKEEQKAKKKSTTTRRKKVTPEATGESDTANAFLNAVRKAGYTRK